MGFLIKAHLRPAIAPTTAELRPVNNRGPVVGLFDGFLNGLTGAYALPEEGLAQFAHGIFVAGAVAQQHQGFFCGVVRQATAWSFQRVWCSLIARLPGVAGRYFGRARRGFSARRRADPSVTPGNGQACGVW